MNTLRAVTTVVAGCAGALLACACAAPVASEDTDSKQDNAVVDLNGLSAINGLTAINGLSAVNGLSAINGLSSEGLVSGAGLMTTEEGRETAAYLVRCALPADHSITKTDDAGQSYTFSGGIGVAPEWETGACDATCQENVSACMLAHINTSGRHISLWLDSDNPAIGYGQSTLYPYQEGSFFGNIFESPPQAYYCNGKDFELGVVPGRLGADIEGAPYTNPFGTDAYCQGNCVAAPFPSTGDGYQGCAGYGHVITVWRNFDPTTNYKICNRASGACLTSGIFFSNVLTSVFQGSTNQLWHIVQVSPGKYMLVNVKVGEVLDLTFAFGETLGLSVYRGAPSQMWMFVPTGDGFYRFTQGSNPGGSFGSGLASCDNFSPGAADQQWNVTPVD